MTTRRIGSLRAFKALLVALTLGGGLAATGAEAAPAFVSTVPAAQADLVPVQYWGDHGGWGHRRHHHHDDHYGHRRGGYGRDHDWGHRRHGWGHREHGWGHRHHGHHHHHRGHGRYDY